MLESLTLHTYMPCSSNAHALIVWLSTSRGLWRTICLPGQDVGQSLWKADTTRKRECDLRQLWLVLKRHWIRILKKSVLTVIEIPTSVMGPSEGLWPWWPPLNESHFKSSACHKADASSLGPCRAIIHESDNIQSFSCISVTTQEVTGLWGFL